MPLLAPCDDDKSDPAPQTRSHAASQDAEPSPTPTPPIPRAAAAPEDGDAPPRGLEALADLLAGVTGTLEERWRALSDFYHLNADQRGALADYLQRQMNDRTSRAYREMSGAENEAARARAAARAAPGNAALQAQANEAEARARGLRNAHRLLGLANNVTNQAMDLANNVFGRARTTDATGSSFTGPDNRNTAIAILGGPNAQGPAAAVAAASGALFGNPFSAIPDSIINDAQFRDEAMVDAAKEAHAQAPTTVAQIVSLAGGPTGALTTAATVLSNPSPAAVYSARTPGELASFVDKLPPHVVNLTTVSHGNPSTGNLALAGTGDFSWQNAGQTGALVDSIANSKVQNWTLGGCNQGLCGQELADRTGATVTGANVETSGGSAPYLQSILRPGSGPGQVLQFTPGRRAPRILQSVPARQIPPPPGETVF